MRNDNRTREEKVQAIIHKVKKETPKGGIEGQVNLAIKCGLRKYEVSELMPDVVNVSSQVEPGHRVLTERLKSKARYRMLNMLTPESLEESRARLRKAITALERAINEFDLDGNGPLLKLVVSQARITITSLRQLESVVIEAINTDSIPCQ